LLNPDSRIGPDTGEVMVVKEYIEELELPAPFTAVTFQ
jgi:hypothetical protein